MYVCVCVLSLFGRTKKFQHLPEMSHTIPDQQSNTCPFCSHSVTQLPFGVAALHTGSHPFYAQSPDLNQSLIRSHASSSLSPATCKSFACIASVTLLAHHCFELSSCRGFVACLEQGVKEIIAAKAVSTSNSARPSRSAAMCSRSSAFQFATNPLSLEYFKGSNAIRPIRRFWCSLCLGITCTYSENVNLDQVCVAHHIVHSAFQIKPSAK